MLPNLLIFLSDEHRRDALGCAGHPLAQTPHLDRLAAGGTRFTNAYTPCPMCVPARASLHTGRYPHQTRLWDSAQPYDGRPRSWAHELRDTGHEVVSIGKLHFRQSHPRNGFSEEISPLHVRDGVGWTLGLLRDKLPSYERGTRELAEQVGRGETSYTTFDRAVTREATTWLQNQATRPASKPWVLLVSYLSPHYPLIAPAEFYDLYDPAAIPPPLDPDGCSWRNHPALTEFRAFYNYSDHFDEPTRRRATAAYLGLCSFLDDQIGRVVTTLEQTGQRPSTRIIYTSDHGEALGDHDLWTKMSMYESSVGIPLIMAGEGIGAGENPTPVSLVDLYPTIMQGAGRPLPAGEPPLPGRSLFDFMSEPDPDRTAFAEYHDGGTTHAHYMIRRGPWKLHFFAGPDRPPLLFNLTDDPHELCNISARHPTVVADLTEALRRVVDPETANGEAHADQAKRAAALGGRQAILRLGGDFGFTPIEK